MKKQYLLPIKRHKKFIRLMVLTLIRLFRCFIQFQFLCPAGRGTISSALKPRALEQAADLW